MGNTCMGTTKQDFKEREPDDVKILRVDEKLVEEWDKLSFQDPQTILSMATYGIPVYGSSPLTGKFIQSELRQANGFAECARIAYQYHIPLQLSPSVLWLAIAQGFAIHVSENAESLRQQFVSFEGKKTLTVQKEETDLFKFDWQSVIADFSDQVKEHIGQETHSTLCPSFSTSTQTEIVACEITLLDAMKSYFEYALCGGCGISRVKLLGTLSDWQLLRDSTEKLGQYDCDWWIQYLLPVLDKLILAYKGEVDKQFWNSIYVFREGGGSGPPSAATGWIINFFPYIGDETNKRRQTFMFDITQYSKALEPRVSLHMIPCGNSKVPFNYLNLKTLETTSCFFVSGFFSVEVVDGFLAPHVGWAVIKDMKTKLRIRHNYA
ncbi:hypothetical protein FGO68_gene3151 [Halteria grandinella]|uniref:Uncharacterized protein n=1 Tax=Halteria grandinella TaxID=5974 RepID=A0A8J8NMD3_HALGN|nr:hypothetical protein FGO68_gene3151 [Halteria grandinella]